MSIENDDGGLARLHRLPPTAGAAATQVFHPLVSQLRRLTTVSEEDEQALKALPFTLVEAEKRAVLTRVGDLHDECCLLVSAYAYKHKVTTKGAKQILAINLPGEILNLQHALHWPTDYHSTVWRAGRAAMIPGEALRELIFNNAGVARALWLYTHAEAALYREWLLNVARRDLTARLAHLLAEISLRLAMIEPSEDPSLVPVGTGQLASAAGSIPLYVEQSLESLEASGAICREAGGVRIADATALAGAGDFQPDYIFGSKLRASSAQEIPARELATASQ